MTHCGDFDTTHYDFSAIADDRLELDGMGIARDY